MKTFGLILIFAFGCGGGSSKPAQPPAPIDPVPMPAEPTKTAEPTQPTQPAEPTPAEPPKPDPKVALLAAETAAFEKAKPVFDKWCAKCHAEGGKLATKKKRDHFDMTKYPFDGHHAMEVSKEIRKSLAIGGGKPSMPFDKKGAVKGEELAAIAAWADAFDASHAGGAHEGGGSGHKH
ncbi:MAG: c-type cytochrome [Myxococcota bacterium]|nr:c-type cytochrome [Myxococcota bacterium]